MRVLKLRSVSEKTGLKSSAIYQRIAQGTFPLQVKLGPKAVGWLESEIDAWIDALATARDANRARQHEPRHEAHASNNGGAK